MLPGRLCELAGQQQRAGAAGRQHTGQAKLAWPQLPLAPLYGLRAKQAATFAGCSALRVACMTPPCLGARAKGGDR